MNRTEIIELLETLPGGGRQGEEGRDRAWRIQREAPPEEIIEALKMAIKPFTQEVLCDILGEVRPPSSVSALVERLGAFDKGVRGSAADALGKIFGYAKKPPAREDQISAVSAVLRRWEKEEEPLVRATLAQTLALIGDPIARQVLEEAVSSQNREIRHQAEWGLSYLRKKGIIGQ